MFEETKPFNAVFAFFAALLFVYTQTAHMLDIPGLHFDEAWQGLFAFKIANTPGFYPTSAMNSYTTPVVHYLLAAFFKIFSPSLLVMRVFYAFLNFGSLVFTVLLLKKTENRKAIPIYTLLWAVLPLAVHTHRFYIEVTGFHAFCFSGLLYSLEIVRRKKWTGSIPATLFALAGIYSHIAFIAVILSLVFMNMIYQTEKKNDYTKLIVTVCLLSLPLTLKMGVDLRKSTPYLLSLLLAFIAVLHHSFFERTYNRIRAFSRKNLKWLLLVSLLPLFAFLLLQFDGIWPYSQATGFREHYWFPVNSLIFAYFLKSSFKKNVRGNYLRDLLFITLLGTSVIVLKLSPRFFTIPLILSSMWLSIELSRVDHLKRFLIIGLIATWNLATFQQVYIHRSLTNPPTDSVVSIFGIKDSGRDFRPFQKAFEWMTARHCQNELRWVEDDRFLLPVRFLALTSPATTDKCPWKNDDVFFSHIPNYLSYDKNSERTAENTVPPYPHVKLLAHSKEWGDLAFWIRKTETK